MRLLLPLVLLAGCTGELTPTDADTDPVDTDVADTDPPARAALAFPPDAEDLDPDPDVLQVRLVAAPHTFTVGGETVEGYAYNSSVPGPTLRAKVGDTIIAEIVNELDVPTTVHWHGAQAPYAMDGVTWTEGPIPPGGSFIATFRAKRAGTMWYHPHFDTARQVDLGLYGAIVITSPEDPPVDHDVVVIADSWGEEGARTPEDGEVHHDLDAANLSWTFNGVLDPVWEVPAGETARMRVINASNTGYLDLPATEGVRWVGADQGMLPDARDSVVLGPGDRGDAEVRVGGGVDIPLSVRGYSLYGGVTPGGPVARLDVRPDGDGVRPEPLAWPWSTPRPEPDPGGTDLRFVLQGDATLSYWTINGEVFPDVTVPFVPRGQDTIVEVRNISPTEHPFHMHGNAFELLTRDGEPVPGRPVHDTINVRVRETVRLRFRADNPGYWMTHCHILPHAEGGMMTVVEVGEE